MTVVPDLGPSQVSDSSRKARLAQAIQQEVVAGGRVEAQGEFNAILRFGKPVNHVLHLILTVITLGMWALVWIIVWVVAVLQTGTVTLNVDEFGNLLRQKI
jgi:hypothetical protein